MKAESKQAVRQRARDRCEYCHLRQDQDPFYRFHIEHVIARKHDGTNDEDNLALACHHCNEHKGTNLAGIDPVTATITLLFHPRRDEWFDHFEVQQGVVAGRTAVGRTTVEVLNMNAGHRVLLRES